MTCVCILCNNVKCSYYVDDHNVYDKLSFNIIEVHSNQILEFGF